MKHIARTLIGLLIFAIISVLGYNIGIFVLNDESLDNVIIHDPMLGMITSILGLLILLACALIGSLAYQVGRGIIKDKKPAE